MTPIVKFIINQMSGLKNKLMTPIYIDLVNKLRLFGVFDLCLDLEDQQTILDLFKKLFLVVGDESQLLFFQILLPLVNNLDSLSDDLFDSLADEIIEPHKCIEKTLLCNRILKECNIGFWKRFERRLMAIKKKGNSSVASSLSEASTSNFETFFADSISAGDISENINGHEQESEKAKIPDNIFGIIDRSSSSWWVKNGQ